MFSAIIEMGHWREGLIYFSTNKCADSMQKTKLVHITLTCKHWLIYKYSTPKLAILNRSKIRCVWVKRGN